eukprot:COSAG06_NODE_42837_length_378_cov_0.544803_1_plen_75_part_01
MTRIPIPITVVAPKDGLAKSKPKSRTAHRRHAVEARDPIEPRRVVAEVAGSLECATSTYFSSENLNRVKVSPAGG